MEVRNFSTQIVYSKINQYIFKSNERGEGSYIGLADFFGFFSGKSLKFIHSILIFRGLTYDFFENQCISLVKRKANSTIEQQKCKGHEKRYRLRISKMEVVIRFFFLK